MMPRPARPPNTAVELYWTVPQVAERLHAGESTVKHWLMDGRLKLTKAGSKTLVAESDIQRFLKDCTAAAQPVITIGDGNDEMSAAQPPV